MIENLPQWLLMRSVEDDFDIEDWETPEDLEQAQHRPTVGVALGSGAARGWAHIGAIQALEDGGIRPDIVAGTSIGALVGGCYSAGKLDALEQFARSIDKRRLLGLADLKFGGSGLLEGAKLDGLFQETVGNLKIEDLERPFTSVAAELGTGHEIWLGTGSLMEAIKASAALPGIFPPHNVGGRWLVDGALVNPIPVSVCRALGARVVIAIDLTPEVLAANSSVEHPLPATVNSTMASAEAKAEGESEASFNSRTVKWQGTGGAMAGLPGITGVMLESFNIIMDRIGRSRLAGDPPDVKISPKLGNIALFDFHKAEESINIGYETAQRALEEVRNYISLLS